MEQPKTNRIAFLTSGGDSAGMNAAIRAIVRMAIYRGCQPFAVLEGLRGLVQGGSMIVPFGWNDVAQIISEGGTIIKSSRCPEFLHRENRKQAAFNLVQLGIDRLIVIGGDGSLTGADTFGREWADLLQELVIEGKIKDSMAKRHEKMMIVGMAGSIDNDMCGTEVTIGANSSLHRIIEAIDCIHSTARSHQRAFVIEVMGRHCGWLALNAAISCAADWVLIPEDPPEEGWEKQMCTSIARHREMGRSVNIVIVAEGAVDRQNVPIRSEYVKDVLVHSGLDARVTTLGHIQRGGTPSAFDRYLATMQGIKAVEAVLDSDPHQTPSLLVCMNENKMTCRPLMDCVSKTRGVTMAMGDLNFQQALRLRDPGFRANYAMWQCLHHGAISSDQTHAILQGSRIGVMNCGAPCGGMNAAVWATLLYGLLRGAKIIGIFNGFAGLMQGDAKELQRKDAIGLVGRGGSFLGTNRAMPSEDMEAVKCQMEALRLEALIIIGGFEAFSAQLQLTRARNNCATFCIPIMVIPATISNNVPGTEMSIGSDTALNVILQSCDYIRQSASSSRKRVFVVDVQGGYCGYLASMAGLAASATRSYIHEEGLRLADLQRDVYHLKARFTDDRRQGRLIIRNEFCSKTYNAQLISKMFEEEAEGTFDSRWVVLGHLQQGGSPSPLDRVHGVRLAILSIKYIESVLCPNSTPLSCSGTDSVSMSVAADGVTMCMDAYGDISVGMSSNNNGDDNGNVDGDAKQNDNQSSTKTEHDENHQGIHSMVIGIKGPQVQLTPSLYLETRTDMKLRRPKEQWWRSLQHYSRILAKYEQDNRHLSDQIYRQ